GGIGTGPGPLIGKSGAVAAMLEHGLPVGVPRTEHQLRFGPAPDPVPHSRLYRFDGEFLSLVATGSLPRVEPHADGLAYERFLESLSYSRAPERNRASALAARMDG